MDRLIDKWMSGWMDESEDRLIWSLLIESILWMETESQKVCAVGTRFSPAVSLPRSTAAAADQQEDGDDDQGSYQKDGQDHQEQHVAIMPPSRL